MKHSTLPVVAHSPDSDGLPTKLSIGVKLTRTVPIVSNGKRLGEVDPSGKVKWTGPGAAGSWDEYVAHTGALNAASGPGRRKLRASVIDGQVAAVVVSKDRTKRDPTPRPAIEKSGHLGKIRRVR